MGKMIECHKVNPSSDCAHVVRGRDEDEVLQNAEVHAGSTASSRPRS